MGRDEQKKIIYVLPHSMWKPSFQGAQDASERELGDEERKGPTKRKAASAMHKRRGGGLEYNVPGNCWCQGQRPEDIGDVCLDKVEWKSRTL